MDAKILRLRPDLPGGSEQIWGGEIYAAVPRVGETVCVNPHEPNLTVERVEWDFSEMSRSGPVIGVDIFVK